MKRLRLEVLKKAGLWHVKEGKAFILSAFTQATAIAFARQRIAALVARGDIVTLKIKRPSGQIREERTYPRSSDPRRTKG